MSKLPSEIEYTDELNDEFSTMEIQTPTISGDYHYLRDNLWGKFMTFLSFHVVAKPLAFFYLKLKFRHKIVGREKIKTFRRSACFIYGNHTQIIADALIPAFILRPNNIHVIVHPNNTKIPFLGHFIPYLGGLPLPSDMKATRNFIKAIDTLVERKRPVFIYPEAHLWPYYTKIRPFKDTSFRYPYKYNAPVFCFTNTYQKRKNPKKVRIVTYIDGPFYPDLNLDEKEAKAKLRDEVLSKMQERALKSDKEMIHYYEKEQHD